MQEIDPRITGTRVHEYVVCERAAWFTYRSVNFENELVEIGKIIHEKSYKREMKNITGERVSFDFIRTDDGKVEVYEVKKSTKMLDAARWQLAFYLLWLKERGVAAEGVIVVPSEKYREKLTLTEEMEREMWRIISEIAKTIESKKPPRARWKSICKKCSYHDFCWV